MQHRWSTICCHFSPSVCLVWVFVITFYFSCNMLFTINSWIQQHLQGRWSKQARLWLWHYNQSPAPFYVHVDAILPALTHSSPYNTKAWILVSAVLGDSTVCGQVVWGKSRDVTINIVRMNVTGTLSGRIWIGLRCRLYLNVTEKKWFLYSYLMRRNF